MGAAYGHGKDVIRAYGALYRRQCGDLMIVADVTLQTCQCKQ